MTCHAQMQRLQAAQREEAVEGTEHAANRVLQERKALGEISILADDDRPADHVRMAIQVFRDRARHDVEAGIERPLIHGVANVLSATARSPRVRAMSATMERSTSFSSGLLGDSTQIIFVFGRIAASIAERSLMSMNVTSRPAERRRTRSNSRYVLP